MKKLIYIFSYNVCLQLQLMEFICLRCLLLSNIVLANVGALAFREDDSRGVGHTILTILGKGAKCENGILYSVYKYSIDCFGEGTLPCQSGTYESFSPMGKCYEV